MLLNDCFHDHQEQSRAISENKVKLPSKRKLKELEQQNFDTVIQNIPIEELDANPAINQAALCLFQQHRLPELQQKHPEKEVNDHIMTVFKEWSEKMKESKKAKYLRQAAMANKSKLPNLSSGNTEKSTNKKSQDVALFGSPEKKLVLFKNIMARAPKKPPASGYAVFSAEKLPTLHHLDTKLRMAEVSRLWKNTPIEVRQSRYDAKMRDAQAKYDTAIEKFKRTLSPDELMVFEAGFKYNKRKPAKPSPVIVKSQPSSPTKSAPKQVVKGSKGQVLNPSDDLNVSQEEVILGQQTEESSEESEDDSSEDSDDDSDDQMVKPQADDSDEEEDSSEEEEDGTSVSQPPPTLVQQQMVKPQADDSDEEEDSDDDEDEEGSDDEDDEDEDDSDSSD